MVGGRATSTPRKNPRNVEDAILEISSEGKRWRVASILRKNMQELNVIVV